MKKYYSNPLSLLWLGWRFYRQFAAAEDYTEEQLRDYQYRHLKDTLAYAVRHVPYYREAYKAVGFELGDFKSIEDLSKLPFLTKDILRGRPHEDFLSDEAGRLGVSEIKTSGTTGVPLSFACDLTARAAKYGITMRAFHEAGYSLGSMQFILKNCFYADRAFSYSWLTNRVSMHAYMNSKENARACDKLLRRHPPRHVLAHPNALLEFGKSIDDPSLTFRKTRGITSISEPLTSVLKSQIEDCFNSKVFDYYSNMESSLIAYETREKGYLLGEQFSYSEIIPADITVPMNGEIVSTTFFSYAMPLIRYRNADIVKLQANTNGGAFRQIQEVSGRIAETIVLPDGNKVRIFNLMHSQLDNVMMYQIVQNAKNHLFIDVVPLDKAKGVDMKSIIDELVSYVGSGMAMDVRVVETLRKTEAGKTPRIISDIKNN